MTPSEYLILATTLKYTDTIRWAVSDKPYFIFFVDLQYPGFVYREFFFIGRFMNQKNAVDRKALFRLGLTRNRFESIDFRLLSSTMCTVLDVCLDQIRGFYRLLGPMFLCNEIAMLSIVWLTYSHSNFTNHEWKYSKHVSNATAPCWSMFVANGKGNDVETGGKGQGTNEVWKNYFEYLFKVFDSF